MARYEWRPRSQSCHCCFSATVVDTDSPVMIGGEQFVDGQYGPQFEPVGECFDHGDAEKICAALNRAEEVVNG